MLKAVWYVLIIETPVQASLVKYHFKIVNFPGYNWPSRRRLILPIFNFWRLEFYMRTFNACGDLFLQNLAKQKENVEIVPLVQLLTLDILNGNFILK